MVLPRNELFMSSLWLLGMCETFFPWVRDFITFPMARFHCSNWWETFVPYSKSWLNNQLVNVVYPHLWGAIGAVTPVQRAQTRGGRMLILRRPTQDHQPQKSNYPRESVYPRCALPMCSLGPSAASGDRSFLQNERAKELDLSKSRVSWLILSLPRASNCSSRVKFIGF